MEFSKNPEGGDQGGLRIPNGERCLRFRGGLSFYLGWAGSREVVKVCEQTQETLGARSQKGPTEQPTDQHTSWQTKVGKLMQCREM